MMIRTGNPTLNSKTFGKHAMPHSQKMTIDGTVNKSLISLFCVLLTAYFTWRQFSIGNINLATNLMIAGGIIGFILGIVTTFKQSAAPMTVPMYALSQGLFLGGLSATFENMYPGIVSQAVVLTFGTLFCLLTAYKSKLINVTENFKLGIISATGGIALVFIASFILNLFGIQLPGIFDNGPIGIAFSLFVVVIAALNLVLDFDFIEKAAEGNHPQYMEWIGAFGLMVTLIWLYIEILRLLMKLREQK